MGSSGFRAGLEAVRIAQFLTYYRPHISGLTIYVERLARGLAREGHQVTVLTSQYDRALPRVEQRDGVMVIRAPVLARVSKGVIMPTFGFLARRVIQQSDVVHIHLPQFDGAGLAINARLFRRPSVLTYHCDLRLPPSLVNAVAQPVIELANHLAARSVDRVVAYTEDYARHSPFLSRYMHKLRVIPPPVETELPTEADLAAFRSKVGLNNGVGPVIGMAARLATEKGVEILVRALEIIRHTHPQARVLFAGPYRNVLGEEAYAQRLQPHFDALGSAWSFLGALSGRELSAFFAACDVTVLPSLNSTESFGLVQVESMLCGTPSVCSNLPGVRVAVQSTGMGEVVAVGDAQALAEAILRVYAHRARYVRPREAIERLFSTARTVREYLSLYDELIEHASKGERTSEVQTRRK
ncbi:MAG: glycosyltransferase family 4 protein [Anaerolineae bacterium]|nr:glycosyltransferase family 4 protein [Thermoflexales bacterium]MDW8394825.1 glycosyltransferase family 4 protein [Anaerolineae bacterium]